MSDYFNKKTQFYLDLLSAVTIDIDSADQLTTVLNLVKGKYTKLLLKNYHLQQ